MPLVGEDFHPFAQIQYLRPGFCKFCASVGTFENAFSSGATPKLQVHALVTHVTRQGPAYCEQP